MVRSLVAVGPGGSEKKKKKVSSLGQKRQLMVTISLGAVQGKK